MKKILFVIIALFLSACSGLSVQWVASYSTTDLATALKMPTVVVVPPVVPMPATAK